MRRGENGRPRKKYGAWRDGFIAWGDAKQDRREQAKQRRHLAKIEAKRLKQEGKSDAEAKKQTQKMLGTLPGDKPVDFFQSYAFDLFQHFNLDRPELVRQRLGGLDRWIGDLADRCEEAGVRLLLLGDHGQETVSHYVDLKACLLYTSPSPRD